MNFRHPGESKDKSSYPINIERQKTNSQWYTWYTSSKSYNRKALNPIYTMTLKFAFEIAAECEELEGSCQCADDYLNRLRPS